MRPSGDRRGVGGSALSLEQPAKREEHERRYVNDAMLFLQARQLGASVLTGNVRDFDFLSQIIPSGRVILYRAPTGGAIIMNAELSPSVAILRRVGTARSGTGHFCVLWRLAKLSTLILDQALPRDFRLPWRYVSLVWPA